MEPPDPLFRCRAAKQEDLEKIAQIHIEAFPRHFLTMLGRAFLLVMYRSFLLSRGSVFLVYQDQDGIQGFSVGVINSGEPDRNLAIKNLFSFSLAIIPALVRHPWIVGKRIWSRIIQGDCGLIISDGTMVLRSIAVSPDMQGRSVAHHLILDFERHARVAGATKMALTTDLVNNDRALMFYERHGYSIRQTYLQGADRRMCLMVKSIDDKSSSKG